MMQTSFRGNDEGGLLPAVAVLSFAVLFVLLALACWTNRYAEHARAREAAFLAGFGLRNGTEEQAHEDD